MCTRAILFTILTLALLGPELATGADAADPVKELVSRAGMTVPGNLYRKPAPDFELPDRTGKLVSVTRDLKGKVSVLYVFVPS